MSSIIRGRSRYRANVSGASYMFHKNELLDDSVHVTRSKVPEPSERFLDLAAKLRAQVGMNSEAVRIGMAATPDEINGKFHGALESLGLSQEARKQFPDSYLSLSELILEAYPELQDRITERAAFAHYCERFEEGDMELSQRPGMTIEEARRAVSAR
ncbi:MAG TPA: hypothetical protein VJC07_00655 [Candidatus Nanoarchaeia archaeon]|nr:hypothetical protein [Candidatus Nanoarchaeia archaeon]